MCRTATDRLAAAPPACGPEAPRRTRPETSMTKRYTFAPPDAPTVAVAGDDTRFPIRRIFCVGRNYAAHAREMGKDPDREPPFFFMKPASAIVDAAAPVSVPYP